MYIFLLRNSITITDFKKVNENVIQSLHIKIIRLFNFFLSRMETKGHDQILFKKLFKKHF